MTVRDALQDAARALELAGCPSPRLDAELLLGRVLGLSRTALYERPERPLDPEAQQRFAALAERRRSREPLAYILGEWGFRRLTLHVDARVLIPRPETEVVVERSLALLRDAPEPWVLDVGTGSGAIALAIADEHPGARVVATDISADALAVAAANRARSGLEGRVELVLGHLVAGLRGPFDLVVSNPPYVPPAAFESLEPEIRLYEPREALVGLGEGAATARRAREVLKREGFLLLEVGDGQAPEVAAQLRELGYAEVAIAKDLAGRERLVEGKWSPLRT